jgi:D-alanyl-D-alanine carboxypeptidase (penicillin-binding protein 5/6)
MSLPGFRAIVATPSWAAKGSRTIALGNINSFLYSYRGADGVKTGYTRRAGHTLVASAVRDGHRLIAVVLNSPAWDADATRLLDWAFATHRWSATE